MNELTSIVEAYRRARAEGARVVLATVVRTRGSVYRRAGARMLVVIDEQGVCAATGAISGGCLERDVCERAQRAAATGEATLALYDTTSADDIVWGLGLGCNGAVEVLLEPLRGERGEELMRFFAACLGGRARGAMATIFGADGEASDQVGSRLTLDAGGRLAGRIVAPALVEDLRRAMSATAAASRGASHVRSYDTPGGAIEVFIEIVEPPVPIIIFGAGADAVPLARLAHETGFRVTVVDHRPAYAAPERFPCADEIIVCRPEAAGEKVALDERTVAVVMTHSYEHDRELLRTLVLSPACYIGMLGPKRRAERMLLELSAGEAFGFGDPGLGRLHAPVGLDIGAETPEEIAVSIIAEVRARIAGRAGGSLRERRGSIHDAGAPLAPDLDPEGRDAAEVFAIPARISARASGRT